MGRMKSELMRQQADRLYPYTVSVEVPPDGLGRDLDRMVGFLGSSPLRIPVWDQHGLMEHGPPGQRPRHWARFYFVVRRAAEHFAEEFRDLGAELREKGQSDG